MKTRPPRRGAFVCARTTGDKQTVMSLVNARHSARSLLYSVYNNYYCFTAIIMMTTETSLVLPLRQLMCLSMTHSWRIYRACRCFRHREGL